MDRIEYSLEHQYQPTNTTCSPTALSMLLSHYGKKFSVEDVSAKVPQVKNEKGENFGTINTQMATWCKSLGFQVVLYTADVQVIDQSWSKLSPHDVIERLEARKSGLTVPSLGELWNSAYCQAYIDFIKSGGELHIVNAITSNLLYQLLKNGPVLPCFAYLSILFTAKEEQIMSTKKKPNQMMLMAKHGTIASSCMVMMKMAIS
jgi:hypothetical protein